jgi:hypothetical protein
MRKIAQFFLAFSEKLNFILQTAQQAYLKYKSYYLGIIISSVIEFL